MANGTCSRSSSCRLCWQVFDVISTVYESGFLCLYLYLYPFYQVIGVVFWVFIVLVLRLLLRFQVFSSFTVIRFFLFENQNALPGISSSEPDGRSGGRDSLGQRCALGGVACLFGLVCVCVCVSRLSQKRTEAVHTQGYELSFSLVAEDDRGAQIRL